MNFNLQLKYDNGIDTGAIMTNYKPPVPIQMRKGNKSLRGHTVFQDPIKSDTLIKFSVAFETHTPGQIIKFKEFRNKYNERFIFVDEFGTEYRGYFQGSFDLNTPIEGDIYYMGCELLCPCAIDGWEVGDDSGL
ncbi:hypothetical protein KPL28_02560 [Clostridium algidicarnis]|uniref:hypothetical protein n=1 Tax=Clostridium algidicarnis TaxID=37659 RepID=UPI001C0D3CD6|nr:hypothetical protein [Clostridium algidicarnis]MBU3208515.1 hypothetical protein [Clostridium algidicarnis]